MSANLSANLSDYETIAALLMAYAPGMPYANAEVIALAVVMDDAIPARWAAVKSGPLNVRAYPAIERDGRPVAVVASLPEGQRLRVWNVREDGWLCVTYRVKNVTGGGWVAGEFLNEVT